MVLDLLGTHAFLPTLLAQLNGVSPHPIPLDPVIFQSILLVLAAGQRKHLILKATDPEEIGIIARTAEWTLYTVFNLATHRLKVRAANPKSTDNSTVNPAIFLRSLFFSPSSSPEASYDERASSCGSISQLARPSGHFNKKQTQRWPSGLTDPFTDYIPPDSPVSHSPIQHTLHLDSTLSSSSHSHRRAPIAHTRHSVSSQHSKSKHKARIPSGTVTADRPHIPTALVVTGLEHASDMSQRALVRVLAEGRVALPKTTGDGWLETRLHESGGEEEETWDLPEDFIMVYVTSWDPRERPAIHKSLLDKFAMSTNITVQSKTKQALRSISISSNITSNPFATQPNSPLFHPHSIPSTPLSASCTLPPHPFPRPQTPHQQTPHSPPNTPKSYTNPFLPDHHRVPSNPTYRGQALSRPHSASPFLATVPLPSHHSDPPDPLLNPAPNRLQAPATTGTNIDSSPALPLPATFLPRLRHMTARHTYISPFLNIYLQDLFTAARFDAPELDGTLLTARAVEDAEKLTMACRILGTELGGWELIRDPALGREMGVEGNEGGEGAAAVDDGNGSNNGSTRGGEFETGYHNPGNSVVVDVGLEGAPSSGDVPTRMVEPRSAVNKQKEKGKVVEWHCRPLKVAFDEAKPRSIVEPSIRTSSDGVDAEVPMFDVSEADVARIVPRVVSHRVRMRDGWTDEVLAGAVCGATFFVDMRGKDAGGMERNPGQDGVEAEMGQGETTVKDVLVRILQRV